MRRIRNALSLLGIAAAAALCAPSARAQITAGQLDDFQDGTTANWGYSSGGSQPVDNVADAGPQGAGDRALYMDTDVHGGGRLLVINTVQWVGDWTAAGVTQIAMDVRNPNDFELQMRLGIVGPGGVSIGGSGDTHVTNSIAVPADDQWYTIMFPALATDFISLSGSDTADALVNVTHVRILSNPATEFIGAFGGAFYLDNIHALGPLPGDYNGNGTVDAADYVVWRKLNGESGAGLAADGTGPEGTPDGVVDELDYDFWRARFGITQSDGGHNHGATAVLAAVPEPATPLLCGAGMFVFAAVCRRTGRSKELAN